MPKSKARPIQTATLEVTFVERMPLDIGIDGQTVGQLVDEILRVNREQDREPKRITLDLED